MQKERVGNRSYTHILQYPSSVYKQTPSELLFERQLRTRLPEFKIESEAEPTDEDVKAADKRAKHNMKMYADRCNHAKSHHLNIEDCVLVKQQRHNKLSSHYDKMTYKITAIKGAMVTASAQNNHTVTRNSYFFKNMPETAIPWRLEEKEEEIDDTMVNQHQLQVNQPPQPINPKQVNQPPQQNRRHPTNKIDANQRDLQISVLVKA